MKARMNLVLLLFVAILGGIGYSVALSHTVQENLTEQQSIVIKEVQTIRGDMRENLAKIRGITSNAAIRLKSLEESFIDHEKRLRHMEKVMSSE